MAPHRQWCYYRLSAQQLARFKAVVASDLSDLDAEQKTLLDRVDAAGRLVAWPDKKHLAELVGTPRFDKLTALSEVEGVAVEGSSQVLVVATSGPLVADGASGPLAPTPAVVHLLNRAYDASKDAMIPQRDLVVRLRRDLFGGRELRKATLHAPKAQPLPLGVSSTDDQVTLKVPELDLWAIVELTP